jgi:hypothetical protein
MRTDVLRLIIAGQGGRYQESLQKTGELSDFFSGFVCVRLNDFVGLCSAEKAIGLTDFLLCAWCVWWQAMKWHPDKNPGKQLLPCANFPQFFSLLKMAG